MDKNLVKGKVFLVIGLILGFISLVKYQESSNYIWLALVAIASATLGGYYQDKSKKTKNPFKMNSYKDVVGLALVMGALVAIVLGFVRKQDIAEILTFGGFAIAFFLVIFSIYFKLKSK
jgi:hypothetical protein